ncbi:MAG: hypothetical protein GC165_05040 [Armatimonadetes bacterium]|nr:hypothetical protein [Armatimonadota bacterium]
MTTSITSTQRTLGNYASSRPLAWTGLTSFDAKKCERECRSRRSKTANKRAKLFTYVVMSNHLHFVVRPHETKTISELVQKIKQRSVIRLEKHLEQSEREQLSPQAGLNRHRYWQRSFRANPLHTTAVAEQKIDYLHQNPVRTGIVDTPEDYIWSSHYAWHQEALADDTSIDLSRMLELYRGLLP